MDESTHQNNLPVLLFYTQSLISHFDYELVIVGFSFDLFITLQNVYESY
jgi:hypothetical protein